MGWGKTWHKVRRSVAGVGTLGLSEVWRNRAARTVLATGVGGLIGSVIPGVGTAAGAALAGGLVGADAMQAEQKDAAAELAEAQRRADEQARIQAERQASISAGNVQQTADAGTAIALSKILKKRSGLQRAIKTGGQQRLGD